MKKIIYAAAVVALASVAHGAIGIVESTGQFDINASSTYYSPLAGGDGAGNPALPADLGTFEPGAGDTLGLENWFFENYAYNSGGGDTIDHNNWLDGTSTATLNMTIDGNLTTHSLTNVSTDENNRKWALNPGSTLNILDGLSNGTYDVSFSIDYTYNWWDGGSTQVGTSTNNAPATASFTVVPEPSSTALLGLGGLALILRRRK